MAKALQDKHLYWSCFVNLYQSLYWESRDKSNLKFTILTQNPRHHVRIFIYQMWPIASQFEICHAYSL